MGFVKKAFFIGVVFSAITVELFRRKLQAPINMTPQDMTGKYVIVTGGTAGIGEETAKVLVEWGANVIVTARSEAKGAATVKRIEDATGKKGMIEAAAIDYASLDSVRAFANKYKASGRPLHALVNNAGMFASGDVQFTKDGHERQVQTNHLGPFLLTNLLLDTLVDSAPSRVVNVASEAYMFGHIDFDDIYTTNYTSEFKRYGTTKLMNVLFSAELNRRLAEAGHSQVVSNSLHPGGIYTDIYKEWDPRLQAFMKSASSYVMRSIQDGAKTSIKLATDPEYAPNASGGLYFEDGEAATLGTEEATDMDVARRLWEVSEKLVGLKE